MPSKTHKILSEYLRMAHGIGGRYTDERAEAESCRILTGGEADAYYLPLVKPSHVQNLIFSSELRAKYGNISDVPGFTDASIFSLPKWSGVLVPMWTNGEIRELKFYSHKEAERPLKRAA